MAVNRTNNVGAVGLTECPAEIGFTRERGYYADIAFEGPQAEAKTKLEALVAAGYSPVRMVNTGGDLWRVTAEEVVVNSSGTPVTSSPDDYIKTKWSVPGNMLEKDLWQKPEVKAALDSVREHYDDAEPGDVLKGSHAVVRIKQVVDAILAGQTTVTVITDDEIEGEYTPLNAAKLSELCEASGMTSEEAETIIRMTESRARGVEAFPVSQWVLKRVMTGPLTSSLRGVRTNVNRMYTTAKLVADESVPSNLLDGIPDGFWLKQTPSVDEENDRLVVNNEWWWSEDYDRFALGEPIE